MAFFSQGGGGAMLPGTQELFRRYPGTGTSGAPAPSGRQQMDPFDRWEAHFQRTAPPIRPGRPGSDELSGAYIARNKRAIEESKVHVQDRRRLIALAKRIGVDISDPGALGILWLDAVDEARTASAVDPGIAGLDRGPWEILERWAKTGGYEGKGLASKGKAQTLTQTQSQVNVTNAKTAREVIMAALRARLDRDPRPEEVAKFIADLNAEERANPTVSTTTSKYDAEGNLVDSDTVTEGGAPAPGDFAEGFLTREHDPEADAVRAGQEYFNAAQQLAQAVV